MNKEQLIIAISTLGAICSLGGNIFIILKKRIGYILWIIGNILWIVYNFLSEFNAPMVGMYIIYAIINIIGFIKWGKKK